MIKESCVHIYNPKVDLIFIGFYSKLVYFQISNIHCAVLGVYRVIIYPSFDGIAVIDDNMINHNGRLMIIV